MTATRVDERRAAPYKRAPQHRLLHTNMARRVTYACLVAQALALAPSRRVATFALG